MVARKTYQTHVPFSKSSIKTFLVWTAIGFFLAGCSRGTPAAQKNATPQDSHKTVVVLLDKTASVSDQLGVFSTAAKRIVHSLKPGDSFKLAEITGSSAADFDFVLRTRIPENPAYNVLETNESEYKDSVEKLDKKRKELLASTLSSVQSELEKKPSAMQTDLFGAIYTASLYLSHRHGKKVLVILSDMIEENGHWRFNKLHWSEKIKNRILSREEKLHLVPDMRGITVYVVGARGQTLEVMQNIRDFWTGYFKKAGADMPADNYAHTLLDWAE